VAEEHFEVTCGAAGFWVNVRKVTGPERGQRLCVGEKALKENPKSVTGMKHGWKASEEKNRQEGEKP
jgi:hypothetical protein